MNRHIFIILLIIAGVIIVALSANQFFGVRDITSTTNTIEQVEENAPTD